MKVAIYSDVHLEFNAPFAPAIGADVDVVVLAGDIGVGTDGIDWAKDYFSDLPVVYVAGNHEFYHGHWTTTIDAMRASAAGSNVNFLEERVAVINGVRFIGCTLWTDFLLFGDQQQAEAMRAAIKVMPDFRIVDGGASTATMTPLAPPQTVDRFRASRAFLEDAMRQSFDGPTIVVTHHLPHKKSVAKRFKRDLVSAAFASDLSATFRIGYPDLWIHGHTHDSFDYSVGKTRVRCNPRGYPQKNGTFENPAFDPLLVVEVL